MKKQKIQSLVSRLFVLSIIAAVFLSFPALANASGFADNHDGCGSDCAEHMIVHAMAPEEFEEVTYIYSYFVYVGGSSVCYIQVDVYMDNWGGFFEVSYNVGHWWDAPSGSVCKNAMGGWKCNMRKP